jgi:L-alanine-DL-glutamate epimerase-like enolase superfamily enzyme
VKVDSVEARTYKVPTDQPEADGTMSWSSTTVVVALVHAGGETGTGWTYGTDASRLLIQEELADAVTGSDPMAVTSINESMSRQCRNLGRPGVAAHSISAVDVALWDLKAHLLGTSVASLLGPHRTEVPVYGSGGFTTYDDKTTRQQLEHWVRDLEVASCKIKVGEDWGSRMERDFERTSLARETIGDSVELMVDANGAYSKKQAVRFGERVFADYGVTWFEEPVSSDDLVGLGQIRNQLPIDVTAGEYGYHLPYFAHMIAAEAVDCLQIDVTRCGGYTGWLAAAALARAHNIEVSGHCAPNLHAPVAAAVPHLRHVEYFHDHARLDPLIFDGTPQVCGGVIALDLGRPGHGMVVRGAGADQYRTG